MKHDMNEKSGYYQGPDGVFYDSKHNEIFELEFEGARIYRKKHGVVGKAYRYRHSKNRKRGNAKVIFTGFENVIYLGEL